MLQSHLGVIRVWKAAGQTEQQSKPGTQIRAHASHTHTPW